jgi:hypothetical protein
MKYKKEPEPSFADQEQYFYPGIVVKEITF